MEKAVVIKTADQNRYHKEKMLIDANSILGFFLFAYSHSDEFNLQNIFLASIHCFYDAGIKIRALIHES